MTKNNNDGHQMVVDWNERELKFPSSSEWRASLVPAAAVIPAPRAYINAVDVKKFVVESHGDVNLARHIWRELIDLPFSPGRGPRALTCLSVPYLVAYFAEIVALNAPLRRVDRFAWNNGTRLSVCFVGFKNESNDEWKRLGQFVFGCQR